MTPVKNRTRSETIGRIGVFSVGALIEELGWIFRELPTSDYGIDALVESRDPFGNPSGQLLALQIKAGESWFANTRNGNVIFRGEPRHLAYWTKHSLPVILVLYHPSQRVCFWQSVLQHNIERTPRGWKLTVPLTNRIDEHSLDIWRTLCRPIAGSFSQTSKDRITTSERETIQEALAAYCDLTFSKVGRRYRPELYVPRPQDQLVWHRLTDESAKVAQVFVLVERAGSGKTNLVCKMTQQLLDHQYPCVLILGSDPLNDRFGLVAEVLRATGFNSTDPIDFAVSQLSEIIGPRLFCILIDAINEARDVDLMQDALSELLAYFKKLPVRIMLTCRDIYWSFMKGGWLEITAAEIFSLDLYKFDIGTWPIVRDRYLASFHIQGTLQGDAEEKCRHPLLLRFFCEAYESENVSIVTQIRLKPLFEKYLDKKAQRVSSERLFFRAQATVVQVLEAIAQEMLDTRIMSIPETRIPAITGDAQHLRRDSLYIRLLDEDIMLEEIPDNNSTTLLRRVRFVYEAFLEFMLARVLAASWTDRQDEAITAELLSLLTPSSGLRNILGALQFLEDFFRDRRLSIWKTLAEHGTTWQNWVLSSLRDSQTGNWDHLPTDAFPALVRSSSADTRAAAVELLTVARLRNALDNDNQLLIDVSKSDPRKEVRAKALEILWKVNDKLSPIDKARVVSFALLDPSKAIRHFGQLCLAHLSQDDLALLYPLLEAGLHSQRASTRSFAAMSMNLNVWPQARGHLLKALTDDNHWVKRAALIRLKDHPLADDVPDIAALFIDPKPEVRSLAAIVSGEWKYKEYFRFLVVRLKEEQNTNVMCRLIDAVGALAEPNSIAFLRELSASADFWIRMHAGTALYSVVGVGCIDDLTKAILLYYPDCRWFKAWPHIEDIGGPKAILQLCRSIFLDSRFSQEAGALVVGLFVGEAQLTEEESRARFCHQLIRVESYLQRAALIGLSLGRPRNTREFINHKTTRKALKRLMRSNDTTLRPFACYLLAKYSQLQKAEIRDMLQSEDPETYRSLARALQESASYRGIKSGDRKRQASEAGGDMDGASQEDGNPEHTEGIAESEMTELDPPDPDTFDPPASDITDDDFPF